MEFSEENIGAAYLNLLILSLFTKVSITGFNTNPSRTSPNLSEWFRNGYIAIYKPPVSDIDIAY